MPSPRGTNFENLYLSGNGTPVAAYDEAPEDAPAGNTPPKEQLLNFLKEKLDEGDAVTCLQLIANWITQDPDSVSSLSSEASVATDSARRYGRHLARQTTAKERAQYEARFPDANRLK
jgi:hypothetical protein